MRGRNKTIAFEMKWKPHRVAPQSIRGNERSNMAAGPYHDFALQCHHDVVFKTAALTHEVLSRLTLKD